jgi:ATP-dependent Clp protease adaptor protein ClpS
MLKVLVFNDDTTTMEFVVSVLEVIFNQSREEALKTMLSAHRNGSAVCGTYPAPEAHAKMNTVAGLAQRNGYPLRFAVGEADTSMENPDG